MALPYPSAPITRPAYNEDRGTSLFDTATKSTKQKLSAYLKEDTCGRQVYLSFSGAASINQLVNCIPVLAASFSFSFLVPIRTFQGNLAAVLDIVDVITEQMNVSTANSVYSPAEVTAAVTAAMAAAVNPDVDIDDNQFTRA